MWSTPASTTAAIEAAVTRSEERMQQANAGMEERIQKANADMEARMQRAFTQAIADMETRMAAANKPWWKRNGATIGVFLLAPSLVLAGILFAVFPDATWPQALVTELAMFVSALNLVCMWWMNRQEAAPASTATAPPAAANTGAPRADAARARVPGPPQPPADPRRALAPGPPPAAVV